MPLSHVIQSRLIRLGATLPTAWDAPTHLGEHELAEPLRQLAGVTWPDVSFENDEEDELWTWMLELGGIDWLDTSEIDLDHEGPLAHLGVADGGNYFLVLRMDDPDPSDPVVYQVDHDDPGQTLHGGVRLSRLLGSLRPEGTDEASLPPLSDVDPVILSMLEPEIDGDRIRRGPHHVSPREAVPLVAYYHSLGSDWARKTAVVTILQDCKSSALEPIMLDYLRTPSETGDDELDDDIRHAKVDALVNLTGDTSLYSDREATLASIPTYLASRAPAV